MGDKNKGVSFPEDVTSLSNEELEALETDAVAEFQALSSGEVNEETMSTLRTLAAGIKTVRKTTQTRAEAAAKQKAEFESLVEQVGVSDGDGDGDGGADASKDGGKEAVTAASRPQGGARTNERKPGMPGLNVPLSEVAARQAEKPKILGKRRESVLVASADIPNYATGSTLDDMESLVAAMQSRARSLPILSRGDDTTRYPIASLQRDFRYTLDPNASPEQINDVLTAAADPDALVAAGLAVLR
jgi:hypothetical protein